MLGMSTQTQGVHLGERELGDELARSAEALLAGATPGDAEATHSANLAIGKVLLALYWELRHQRPARPQIAHRPAPRTNGCAINKHDVRVRASEPGA